MTKRNKSEAYAKGEGPSADYDVGYGKPPKASRFKSGKSGNPKGRPKGATGFHASLVRELSAKVVVVENGVRKSMTKGDAVAKRAVEKGLKGDLSAIRFMSEVDQTFALAVAKERAAQADVAAQEVPSQSEAEMLAYFAEAARLGRWGSTAGAPGPQEEEQKDD